MTKVRVLYPSAFVDVVTAGDVVDIDDATAEALIGEGFAEPVKARTKKDE